MKLVGIQKANLLQCLKDAQRDRVVFTRNGKPVAVLVGVQGMDLEQLMLGHSDKFWTLISGRRRQKTMTRKQLERRLANKQKTA